MTQEDRKLLLIDLSTRLPYGVKFLRESWNYEWDQEMSVIEVLEDIDKDGYINNTKVYKVEDIKPYLRPMSSMTEEEFVYFMSIRGMNLKSYEIQEMMSENFSHPNRIAIVNTLGRYSHNIDWLNENMFDYRGLIPKGLAIEVTKENNPYEN